ncbi:type II toxin-antitoxin system VapC family toxin [Desertibaculum subflavum]|uniref:type II toxin-antitoxin system VapC family toxin n=1 Tax=Desertibaculum subflavum TaxID=2268458 RepID=UPI000E6671AE
MSLYLDASVLVALFTNDALSERADAFLRDAAPVTVLVSDFAGAELTSAIARRVRMAELSADDARIAFANFDAWSARAATRADMATADVAAASAFLRRLDLTLRTPDAINIAIAQRLGARLATFDLKMAVSATALGVGLATA